MTKAFGIFVSIFFSAATVHPQQVDPPVVRVEMKLIEVRRVESQSVGFDWYLGNTILSEANKSPDSGSSAGVMPTSPNIGSPTRPEVATMSGILTDSQFKTVVRALENRNGAKVIAAPKGSTLSGSALRLVRPDGWEFQVVPTANTDAEAITVAMTVKQGKGEYAGFELTSSTKVRQGETAVFSDTFATKDKKNPQRNLVLLVTPRVDVKIKLPPE